MTFLSIHLRSFKENRILISRTVKILMTEVVAMAVNKNDVVFYPKTMVISNTNGYKIWLHIENSKYGMRRISMSGMKYTFRPLSDKRWGFKNWFEEIWSERRDLILLRYEIEAIGKYLFLISESFHWKKYTFWNLRDSALQKCKAIRNQVIHTSFQNHC